MLYFVQRLRDEAHRFAIGTHRAKRSKAIGANPLDEIAGIGPRASARCSSISARQGGVARQPGGPAGRRRHQRPDGADHLRFLPRAARLTRSLALTVRDILHLAAVLHDRIVVLSLGPSPPGLLPRCPVETPTGTRMASALDGLTVLDLSTGPAAALATMSPRRSRRARRTPHCAGSVAPARGRLHRVGSWQGVRDARSRCGAGGA